MDIVEMVEIRLIRPSPNQTRGDLGAVEELMASIRAHGLLHPIVIRPRAKGFEVISGHRRLEACRKLHWFVIPSMVKDVADREAYEISLVENLQRNSLSALEEARAYERYTQDFGWGGVSELAERIGKSPSYVSHVISLLKLPLKVREKLESNEITRSAAQELLWIEDEELQLKLAEGGVTVKEIRQTAAASSELAGKKFEDYSSSSSAVPFATNNWVRDYPSPKGERQVILKKAALSVRIALIRLDSLIEKTHDANVKKFLVQERYAIHRVIDEILSASREN